MSEMVDRIVRVLKTECRMSEPEEYVARAVLRAMREPPTEAMDIADHAIITDSWERSAKSVWQAMIDAAVK